MKTFKYCVLCGEWVVDDCCDGYMISTNSQEQGDLDEAIDNFFQAERDEEKARERDLDYLMHQGTSDEYF